MKSDIERYIREIRKGLQLPYKTKKHIIMELKNEIYARLDTGEKLDDILKSIGSPQEVIKKLEASYENEYIYFRKESIFKLIVLSVIAFCMTALIVYSIITILYPQFILPTVIGGVNGNTSAFIAYKWSSEELIVGLLIKILIFIFSLLQIIKIFKSLKNNKGV